MMKRIGWAALIAIALVACNPVEQTPAAAAVARSTSQALQSCDTLTASADAVLSNPPLANNFGALPILRVGGKDESLVRFDLSSVPAGAVLTSATLQLYVAGGDTGGTVRAHRATAPWDESQVTYENFAQQFDPNLAGAFTVTATSVRKSIDLTSLVRSWLLGAQPNDGVLLESSGKQKAILVSREGGTSSQTPQLTVCYALPDDHCAPNPCIHGVCENQAASFTCHCATGYTGATCDTLIDSCGSAPCLNGGTCTNGVGTYSCACATGYAGNNCETLIDNCANQPCQNGGVCTNGVGSYSCQCAPGYTGTNCDTLIDNCAAAPCQNGGTCSNGVASYSCSCAIGFTGTQCELNVDDCASQPCHNGGTCIDGIGSFTCSCAPGFTGPACDQAIDSCALNPCLHYGACTNSPGGGYTCACAPGFSGANCEIDSNDCSTQPCGAGYVCADRSNGYVCVGAGAAPTVALQSPFAGTTLTAPTPVLGMVSGGFWYMEYALGSNPPVMFARGFNSGQVSATFDTTLLVPGLYTIQLTALTDQGTATAAINVMVTGKLSLGAYQTQATDLDLPAPGPRVVVERRYDSRDTAPHDFGIGWSLGVNSARIETTDPLGAQWEEIQHTVGFFPQYCVQSVQPRLVSVTLDGRVLQFSANADLGGGNSCSVLFPAQFGNLTFTAMPGTNGTLVALDDVSFQVSGGPVGPIELLSDTTFEPISPKRFQLTTDDGTVYVLRTDSGVERITDRNGDQLSVGAAGLTHTSTRTAVFTRDTLGRIVSVTDPKGQVMTYSYDSRGHLSTYTDRAGRTVTFSYDPAGHLTFDGASHLTYDAMGRLVAKDSATYSYDLANDSMVETIAGASTVTRFDARGDAISITDPLGATTVQTFDVDGNLITTTAPNGQVTQHTYDSFNRMTSTTDWMGHVTSFTFNPFGEVLTMTEWGGLVTQNTYDARGNLLSTTDPSGQTISHTYTAAGLLATTTDASGATTAFNDDALGEVISQTDAAGTTTFTYDANGNRLSETDPLGRLTTYLYDALDRLIQTTVSP